MFMMSLCTSANRKEKNNFEMKARVRQGCSFSVMLLKAYWMMEQAPTDHSQDFIKNI